MQGVHPIRDMPALPVGTLPEEDDVPQVRLVGPPQLHAQVLKPEMHERLDCVRALRETRALQPMRQTGEMTVTLLHPSPGSGSEKAILRIEQPKPQRKQNLACVGGIEHLDLHLWVRRCKSRKNSSVVHYCTLEAIYIRPGQESGPVY